MQNLENLKSEIKEQIKEAMNNAISDVDFINLNAYEKVKADPYCLYNVEKDSFYLSTTEDDSFDDYIKFDDVIDLFIESYGGVGNLSNEAADKFVARLSGAIEKINKAKGDL